MRSIRYGQRAVPILALLAACGGGGTDLITPPPPPAVEFVLTLVPHPDDITTSTALGWQAAIPAMAGTIIPADSSAPAKSFTTSAEGRAVLAGLTAGDYIVEASRWLNATEKGKLPVADDAVGFAGRWKLNVVNQDGTASLPVPASRRHGLVISEFAFNLYSYIYGGFIELFNNADTTIYLDGIIVGEGWSASFDLPIAPCPATAPFRNDPQGIWARVFHKFPGSGHEHPLGPGGTVVVATDAIDHRPLSPLTLDLSSADFEFRGSADVDNPAVPDMVDQGIHSYLHGHGSTYSSLVHVPFLALPLDPATLPREVTLNGAVFTRIPGERIIDAFALGTNYPPPGGASDCPPLVHARFDREESRARGTSGPSEYEHSVSRRRIPPTGGVAVLQWTRSGNADLVRTSRTPGTQASQ